MDIAVKFDYKDALKEFNNSVKKLEELAQKKVVIKIDENAIYDNGTKVEIIAFYMEFGSDKLNVHYPARPFWRMTLSKYESYINNRYRVNLQALLENKMSVNQFYEDLGKQFKSYLIATIKEGNFVPLAKSTLKSRERKGTGTQPLLDSRTLINSIVYEVV